MNKLDKSLVAEALEWRARIDNDIVDANVRASFQRWVMADPEHMQAYDYAERFWDRLGDVSLEDIAAAEALQQPHAATSTKKRSNSAWAATIVLMLGACAFWMLPEREPVPVVAPAIVLATTVGETREHTLSDGSVLTLGPDSQLDATINDKQRFITLWRGEVFFDVSEDRSRPFVIQAGDATVRVLGTTFNVRMSAASTHVAVAAGRVGVVAAAGLGGAGEPVPPLSAGQAVSVSKTGRSDVSAVRPDSVGAWRDDRLVFSNEPLAELVAQIDRYDRRDIIITDNDLASLAVTATFDAKDIDGLLVTLAEIYPLTIQQTSDDRLLIQAID